MLSFQTAIRSLYVPPPFSRSCMLQSLALQHAFFAPKGPCPLGYITCSQSTWTVPELFKHLHPFTLPEESLTSARSVNSSTSNQ